MRIIQAITTSNECYLAGSTIKVAGLMLHSVGVPQPSAAVFARNFNVARPNGQQVAVHAFLQADGTVYQTLPWNHRGWHCGGGPQGSGNNTHIGVEMTEPDTIRYTGGASWVETGDGVATRNFVLGAYRTAVELFAYLCQEYHLDPLADGVIISHSEGARRGLASNHGDVEHLWGKFDLSMAQFRREVKAALFPREEPTAVPDRPYLVKVAVAPLHVRSGPGTAFAFAGTIEDRGTYTIVEEACSTELVKWGKLKSGAGWIPLAQTQKPG